MTGVEEIFQDRFITGLVLAGGARLLAVDARGASEEVHRRHHLVGDAVRLASEGVVAALLMSSHIKGEERITFQVQSEAPPCGFVADVFADGSVRARFTPHRLGPSPAIRGFVLVIKHDDEREIYRGVAAIENTDLQGALQGYLVRSQQTVGIVRIRGAFGLLIEKMPGMEEALFNDLFGGLDGDDPDALARELATGHLHGMPFDVLEDRPVRFSCPCNPDRARTLLRGLGVQEVRSLLEEQGRAELTCNFCQERYVLERTEVEAILRQLETT